MRLAIALALFLLALLFLTTLSVVDHIDPEPHVEVEAGLIPPLNLEAPPTTAPVSTTSTTAETLHRAHETAPTVPKPAPNSSRWYALAACESGGRWHIFDSLHSGGLQFAYATWRQAGGEQYAPVPHQATPEQQIAVAKSWLRRTSPSQWPVCGPRVGLTMADAA